MLVFAFSDCRLNASTSDESDSLDDNMSSLLQKNNSNFISTNKTHKNIVKILCSSFDVSFYSYVGGTDVFRSAILDSSLLVVLVLQ